MSYQMERLEKNQVKFTFDVTPEDWTAEIEKAYQKNKNKFSVEGFRKGHVPKKVIERMYGTGVFFEDALDIIIPKYYGEAIEKETEVMPVASPDFDIVAISDATLKFTALVQEKPDVKLGKYTGLELKKRDTAVTDEEVDAEIRKAQDKLATWEDVTDRACELGDKVTIDYSGSVDGVKFDGGTAEKQDLVLGSGMFIPGFEEKVVGMKIGEEKDITVKFPKDYGADNLAGKEAVFAIKLHAITVKEMPAIDDELAKDVSDTANTLEEYKAEIRKNLEDKKKGEAEIAMENELIDTIADSSEVEIPDVMIDQQADDMVYEFEYRLQSQGLKPEDYYKYTKSTRDEVKAQYLTTAKKHVLMRLVMEAIIKAENIDVTEEELDAKLADFAKGANKEFEEYKKSVNKEQIDYLKNHIATDKLLTFLKDNNKFI